MIQECDGIKKPRAKKEAKQIDLEATYYQALTEIFTKGKPTLKTPIGNFAATNIENLLKKAKNPYSADIAIKALGSLVKETQDYNNSRDQQDLDYTEYLINRKCIPWQREFFVDNAKRITNQSGRRAGKSYANALKAIKHCLVGNDTINGVVKLRKAVIIGLTKEKVMEQYWQLIKDTIEECHINTLKIDNALLQVTFSSGATLKLAGNNSKAEREKLRGDEYSLVIIDEAQSQTGLRYLMNSILEPIAYARDTQIILTGTGALLLGSYWQDVTDGDLAAKWRHYHVTMADNPTIVNPETVLEQVRIDKGWTEDDPEYVREYLGKNCYDSTRNIIPIRHYYEELPKNVAWERCIVGLDYGWSDKTSFVPMLVANTGQRYVVDSFSASHLSSTEIIAKAKEINEWAKSLKVLDTLFIADVNDQSISIDLYRCGIKIQNAYKIDERMQWSYLAEAMRKGELLIVKGGVVDKEAEKAVWQYSEEKKQIIQEPDDDVFHVEALDALKYANYYWKTKKKSRAYWDKS